MVAFSNFATVPYFGGGLIRRIIDPDESHLCQKRTVCGPGDGGRISARFPPTEITKGAHFPILRLCRTMGIFFPRLVPPDGPHLGQNGHSEGSPTAGGLRPDFRPPQLRAVSNFPNLRFYRTSEKANSRIATVGGPLFWPKRRI